MLTISCSIFSHLCKYSMNSYYSSIIWIHTSTLSYEFISFINNMNSYSSLSYEFIFPIIHQKYEFIFIPSAKSCVAVPLLIHVIHCFRKICAWFRTVNLCIICEIWMPVAFILNRRESRTRATCSMSFCPRNIASALRAGWWQWLIQLLVDRKNVHLDQGIS